MCPEVSYFGSYPPWGLQISASSYLRSSNVCRTIFFCGELIDCYERSVGRLFVILMSMEIDNTQHSVPKRSKRPKEKNIERSEKKRKRQESDDFELTSPIKKHRSKSQPGLSKKSQSPSTPETQIISSFFQQSSALYLPLPPISQKHALKGLCAEYLSPLILTYYPPFHGVILSYQNARLSSEPSSETVLAYARSIDEYAASFVWLVADFVIFKPQKGNVLEGWVNLQNESSIGLLLFNFFNITIERRRLPKGWKWISGGVKPSGKRKLKKAVESASMDSDEDGDGEQEEEEEVEEVFGEDVQGYFQDGHGKKIEGLVRFQVRNVETSRSMDRETSFLNIEGTMLNETEEKELQEQEAMRMKEKGKQQPRYAMAGALMNGYDGSMDVDQPKDFSPSLKHRAKY